MTTLVIDVGSSSIRTLLFGSDGKTIPNMQARREHRFMDDATADANDLRALVESCIDETLAHPAIDSISAVGMTTFVGNMLGVDAKNLPLTPLYTYADTGSYGDAVQLIGSLDMRAIHARTGCRIHPAYHPAKLHWLKRSQPDLFTKVHCWTDFATYCYRMWFDCDVPCSYSVASWSGLLDSDALQWDTAWLDQLSMDKSVMPRLADFTAVQQGLSASYVVRWPSLRNVPFYLAVGDGAAANIGSGGISPERPVLTVGTTAAMRIVTRERTAVPIGLWSYRVDTERHLIGGATSEGGNIFSWARDTLRLDTSELDAALQEREPGGHGLVTLPLHAGERSPGYIAEASGTIHGLRLDTTPLDILHALLEGVALRLRLIYELMDSPGEYVLAGGGALVQSAAWAQIMADVLGVPLHVTDTPEATARGVALLIAEHRYAASLSEPQPGRVVTPCSGTTAIYAEMLDRQRDLYQRLYTG